MADSFKSASRVLPVTGALAGIGKTPLLPLRNIHPGPGLILAKAEFLQPGGSIKDRAALKAITYARECGELLPGQPVYEMTSGNMGAGLAVVCNALDHPFTAVISAGNSPERVKMMRALGANVIIVDQIDGKPGEVTGNDLVAVEIRARALAKEQQGFFVDQFNNLGSVLAHFEHTGPELWQQSGHKLDAFVACVGSAGTLMGVSKFLKSMAPSIQCLGVEPENVSVLTGGRPQTLTHTIQGTGYGRIPPQFDPTLMDGVLLVSDAEANAWREKLATKEGLYVGYSAAANVCAASKWLKRQRSTDTLTIGTVLCDSGFKYS